MEGGEEDSWKAAETQRESVRRCPGAIMLAARAEKGRGGHVAAGRLGAEIRSHSSRKDGRREQVAKGGRNFVERKGA